MDEIKRKEERNYELFLKMISELDEKDWEEIEEWKLRPEANFFMTAHSHNKD